MISGFYGLSARDVCRPGVARDVSTSRESPPRRVSPTHLGRPTVLYGDERRS